jgi:hypothetical protein
MNPRSRSYQASNMSVAPRNEPADPHAPLLDSDAEIPAALTQAVIVKTPLVNCVGYW